MNLLTELGSLTGWHKQAYNQFYNDPIGQYGGGDIDPAFHQMSPQQGYGTMPQQMMRMPQMQQMQQMQPQGPSPGQVGQATGAAPPQTPQEPSMLGKAMPHVWNALGAMNAVRGPFGVLQNAAWEGGSRALGFGSSAKERANNFKSYQVNPNKDSYLGGAGKLVGGVMHGLSNPLEAGGWIAGEAQKGLGNTPGGKAVGNMYNKVTGGVSNAYNSAKNTAQYGWNQIANTPASQAFKAPMTPKPPMPTPKPATPAPINKQPTPLKPQTGIPG